MSRLNVGNLYNENEDGAPVVSGISTFSSPYYFVPPSGSTAERPQNPGEGMIRFNTDSGHLEYYTGTHWADVITNNNELGNQNVTNSAGGTGTRGLIMGGEQPGTTDTIEYITIDTLGNAQDFGNLLDSTGRIGSLSSSIRGFRGGGYQAPTSLDRIDFVTFSSTGDATDFGDMNVTATHHGGGCCSPTRGVIMGGYVAPAYQNYMSMINISTQGDAVDWGTTLAGGRINTVGCSNAHGGL